MKTPQIMIIAGPNGVGKPTSAPGLLSQETTFLNAHEIAKGLPGLPTAARDVQARRRLLQQLDELETRQADIAVETTLSSRTLAPRIVRLQDAGYRFYLFFFWLPSADMAVAHAAERVRRGGHDIPEPVIRRRYVAGLRNFLTLYRPLANSWRMYDNARAGDPGLIAKGTMRVGDFDLWRQLEEQQKNEDRAKHHAQD